MSTKDIRGFGVRAMIAPLALVLAVLAPPALAAPAEVAVTYCTEPSELAAADDHAGYLAQCVGSDGRPLSALRVLGAEGVRTWPAPFPGGTERLLALDGGPFGVVTTRQGGQASDQLRFLTFAPGDGAATPAASTTVPFVGGVLQVAEGDGCRFVWVTNAALKPRRDALYALDERGLVLVAEGPFLRPLFWSPADAGFVISTVGMSGPGPLMLRLEPEIVDCTGARRPARPALKAALRSLAAPYLNLHPAPGGERVLVTSGDDLFALQARLLDTRTGELRTLGEAPRALGDGGAVSADGALVALPVEGGVAVVRVRDQKTLQVVPTAGHFSGRQAAFSRDGTLVFVGSSGAGAVVARVAPEGAAGTRKPAG